MEIINFLLGNRSPEQVIKDVALSLKQYDRNNAQGLTLVHVPTYVHAQWKKIK